MVRALHPIGIGLATVCPWQTVSVAPPGTPQRLPAASTEAPVGNPAGAFGVLSLAILDLAILKQGFV
ncbi:MAG TPA: hypothetical protein DCE28_03705 [Halomonas sp.]|nr:hypothetical protein [Halomonas sp.]